MAAAGRPAAPAMALPREALLGAPPQRRCRGQRRRHLQGGLGRWRHCPAAHSGAKAVEQLPHQKKRPPPCCDAG